MSSQFLDYPSRVAIVSSLSKLDMFRNKEIRDQEILWMFVFIKTIDRTPGNSVEEKCLGFMTKENMPLDFPSFKAAYILLNKLTSQELLRFVVPNSVEDPDGVFDAVKIALDSEVISPHQSKIYQNEIFDARYAKLLMLGLAEESLEKSKLLEKLELILSNDLTNVLYTPVNHVSLAYKTEVLTKSEKSIINKLKKLRETPIERANAAKECYLYTEKKYVKHDLKDIYTRLRKIDSLAFLQNLLFNDKENSVGIECRLFFNKVISYIDIFENKQHVALINPSLHFIVKWLETEELSKTQTSFVLSNKDVYDILKFNSRIVERKNVQLYLEEDWCSKRKIANHFKNPTILAINYAEGRLESGTVNSIVKSCDSRLENDCRIILFAGMGQSANTPAVAFESTDSRLLLHSITILPQNLPNISRPKRKAIAYYSFRAENDIETHNDVQIFKYDLVPVEGISYMSSVSNLSLHISESALSSSLTIEQVRRSFQKNLPSPDRKRGPGYEIDFSSEMKINYSYTSSVRKIIREVRASISLAANEEKSSQYKEQFKKLTEKQTSKVDNDNLESWLLKVFPFSTVLDKNSEKRDSVKPPRKRIRDIVVSECAEWYKNRTDISLRWFWYINPQVDQLFEGEEISILRQIMFSRTGDIMLNKNTLAEIEDLYIAEFTGFTDQQIEKGFNILHQVLHVAVELKNCPDDLFPKDDEKDEQNQRRRDFEVRRGIANRSFSLKQMQDVMKQLPNISSAKISLGIMLRMLTGLSANEICALRWEDIIENEYGMWMICIWRQIRNDGSEFIGFNSKRSYRYIPCPSIVYKRLNSLKKRHDKKYSDLTAHCRAQHPIFSKGIIGEEVLVSNHLKPKELSKACKNVIKNAGIPNEMIDIPTGNGSRETNLNRYYGDFLRSNADYHLKTTAAFTEGELAHVLSRKPDYTVNDNYIDFNSPSAQFVMMNKMKRLESCLFPSDLKKHASVVIIRVPKGKEINLTVKCKHGSKVVIEKNYRNESQKER